MNVQTTKGINFLNLSGLLEQQLLCFRVQWFFFRITFLEVQFINPVFYDLSSLSLIFTKEKSPIKFLLFLS